MILFASARKDSGRWWQPIAIALLLCTRALLAAPETGPETELEAGSEAAKPAELAGLGAALTIEMTGLEGGVGQVHISVFDSADTWLREASYDAIVDVEESELSWTAEELPAGDYGIAIFHDVNSNGINDKNRFGIPSEPYGFSNNYRVRFGPPKWAKASFEVTAPATVVRIRIK